MNGKYDIAIIGAGPAGSSAAIEAVRAGARVLLLEKSSFPRHKVCGEFLSPEVGGIVTELGCGHLLDRAVPLESAQVHTSSGRTLDFPLEPRAHSLSRFALDDGLAREACRLGVDFQPGTPVAEGDAIPAPIVILAWGRRIAENRPGAFFGFKAHFLGEYPRRVDLHFFHAGYVGISPVEDGRINVCALVEKRLVRSAEEITRLFLGDNPKQEWPFLFTGPLHPGWQNRDLLAGGAWAAGDAAAFLDPFTGDGISLAMRSGRLAARAAMECLNRSAAAGEIQARYVEALRRMCRRQFAAARLLRFGAHRAWIEAPVSWLLESAPRLRATLFRVTRGKLAGWEGFEPS